MSLIDFFAERKTSSSKPQERELIRQYIKVVNASLEGNAVMLKRYETNCFLTVEYSSKNGKTPEIRDLAKRIRHGLECYGMKVESDRSF